MKMTLQIGCDGSPVLVKISKLLLLRKNGVVKIDSHHLRDTEVKSIIFCYRVSEFYCDADLRSATIKRNQPSTASTVSTPNSTRQCWRPTPRSQNSKKQEKKSLICLCRAVSASRGIGAEQTVGMRGEQGCAVIFRVGSMWSAIWVKWRAGSCSARDDGHFGGAWVLCSKGVESTDGPDHEWRSLECEMTQWLNVYLSFSSAIDTSNASIKLSF